MAIAIVRCAYSSLQEPQEEDNQAKARSRLIPEYIFHMRKISSQEYCFWQLVV